MNRALIAVFLALCSVPSPTQTPDDYLHSLVGQKLLLRHFGNVTEVKLKAEQLGKISATCDVAVLVRAAEWKKNKVTFNWQEIGTPQVAGKPYPQCPGQNMGYGAVEIEGFKPGESSESLARSVRSCRLRSSISPPLALCLIFRFSRLPANLRNRSSPSSAQERC